MGLVVQGHQLLLGRRMRGIEARDGAQLHMGDGDLAGLVFRHGAGGRIGVAVEAMARAAGEVHEPQHVATGERGDVGLLGIDRCRVGVGQGHDVGR